LVDSTAETWSSTLPSGLPLDIATDAMWVQGRGGWGRGQAMCDAAQTRITLSLEPKVACMIGCLRACPIGSTTRTRSSTLPSRLLRKGATDSEAHGVVGGGEGGRQWVMRHRHAIRKGSTQGCLQDRVLYSVWLIQQPGHGPAPYQAGCLTSLPQAVGPMKFWGRGGWGRGQAICDAAQTQVISNLG
jgi:hypothetical protein